MNDEKLASGYAKNTKNRMVGQVIKNKICLPTRQPFEEEGDIAFFLLHGLRLLGFGQVQMF